MPPFELTSTGTPDFDEGDVYFIGKGEHDLADIARRYPDIDLTKFVHLAHDETSAFKPSA
ncbi:hypothetical protein SKC41_25035 [Mycobacterium sp. 050128]|uniref:hypothetical protein n=1 Tax=Mycobacterium sp. 050128 TaxID=3096112 RepID=UPI002ED83333